MLKDTTKPEVNVSLQSSNSSTATLKVESKDNRKVKSTVVYYDGKKIDTISGAITKTYTVNKNSSKTTFKVTATDTSSNTTTYTYSVPAKVSTTSSGNTTSTQSTVKQPVQKTSSGSGSSTGSGSSSGSSSSTSNDTTNPTIVSLTNKSGSKKVKDKVELVAKVKDSDSGIKGYAWDNSSKVTTSTKWTYLDSAVVGQEKELTYSATKNATFYLHVKDDAGNTTTKSIKVDNIDKTGPTISNITNTEEKTYGKEITYTATLEDAAGLKRYAISTEKDTTKLKDTDWKNISENPTKQTINNLKVNSNSTYYLHAEDTLGNTSKESFKVTNVDNNPPTISSITCDTEEKVLKTQGVKVIVKASDKESGLHFIVIDQKSKVSYEEAQKYNDSEKKTSATSTFTVKENGVWYVHVFDKCGNCTTKSIVVDNLVDVKGSYSAKKVSINDYTIDQTTHESETQYLNENFYLSTTYGTIKRVALTNKSTGLTRGYWLGYVDNAGIIKNYDRKNDPSPYRGEYETSKKINTTSAETAEKIAKEIGDTTDYNALLETVIKSTNDEDLAKRYTSETLQTFAYDLNGDGIISVSEAEKLKDYAKGDETKTTATFLGTDTTNNKKYLFPVIQEEGEYEFDIIRYVDENDYTKKGIKRLDTETYKFVLDKTAPVVKVQKEENAQNGIIYYTGKAVDNLTNIVAYQFRTDSKIPTNSNSNWKEVKSDNNISKAIEVSYQASVNEEIGNVILWVMDEAGNIGYGESSKETIEIAEDITSPTISSFSIDSKNTSSTKVMQKVVATAKDENLKYYQFSADGNLDAEANGWIDIDKEKSEVISDNKTDTTRTVTISTEIPVSTSDGNTIKDYYFYAKDSNGNISVKSLKKSFNRDTQKPHILKVEEKDKDNANNKTLIITATDFKGGTGVKSYKYTQSKDEYESDEEFTKNVNKPFTNVANIIQEPTKANDYVVKFEVNVSRNGAYFFQIKDGATGSDANGKQYGANYSSKNGQLNGNVNVAEIYAKAGDATFETIENRNVRINETIPTVLHIQKDANDSQSEMKIKYTRYSSSDTNIATIDEEGKITGISKGEVTLTATAVNFDNTQISQTLTINVVDEVTEIGEQPTRQLVIGEQETELFTQIGKGTNEVFTWYSLPQTTSVEEDNNPKDADGAIKMTSAEDLTVTAENDSEKEVVVGSTLKLSAEEVKKGKKYVARIANNSDIIKPSLTTAVNTREVSVVSIKQPNTPTINAIYANGAKVNSGDWANQEITITPNSTYEGTSGDIVYEYAVISEKTETGAYELPEDEDWIIYNEKTGLKFGEDDQTAGKMIYFRAYTTYTDSEITEEEQAKIKEYTSTDNIEYNGFEEMYAKFELKLDMVEPEFESYELVPVDLEGNEIEEITIPPTDTKMSKNYIVKAKIKDNFIAPVHLNLNMDNIGETKHEQAEYIIDKNYLRELEENEITVQSEDNNSDITTEDVEINLYYQFEFFKNLNSELYHIGTQLKDESFPDVKSSNNKQDDRFLDFQIDKAAMLELKNCEDNSDITATEKTITGKVTNADDKAIDEKFYEVGSIKNGVKINLKESIDNMSGIESAQYTISAYDRDSYTQMVNVINNKDTEINAISTEINDKKKAIDEKDKEIKDLAGITTVEGLTEKEKAEEEYYKLEEELSELEEELSELEARRERLIEENLYLEAKEEVAVEPDQLNYILEWDGCYVIDVETTDKLNNIAHRYFFIVIDNNDSEDTKSATIKYTDLSETEARIEVEILDVSGIGKVQYKWTTDETEIAKFNEGKYSEITGWKDADGSYPIFNVSTINADIEGEATLLIIAEDGLGNKEPFSKKFKIDGKVTSPATMVFETIEEGTEENTETIIDTIEPDEENNIYANEYGFIKILPGYDINVYNQNKEDLVTTYSYSMKNDSEIGEQDKSGRIKAKITEEGIYTVEVKSKDKLGNEGIVTYTLYVDKTEPEITYDGNSKNGTVEDPISGIKWAKYIYTRGYTPTDEEIEAEGTEISENEFTGVLPDVNIPGSAWDITILAYDKAGNRGYYSTTTGKTWNENNDEDDSAPIAGELQNAKFMYDEESSADIEFDVNKDGDKTKELDTGIVFTHKDRKYTAKVLPDKDVVSVDMAYTKSYDAESDIKEEKIEIIKNEETIYTVVNKKQDNGVMEQESLEGESDEIILDTEKRTISFIAIQDKEEVYQIKITAINGNDLTSINTYNISVDKKAPTVKFTPNGNDKWVYGYKNDDKTYDETAKYEDPIIVEVEDNMAGVNKAKTCYYWTVNGEIVGKIVEAEKITEDDSTKEDDKKEKFQVEIPSEVAEILENTVAGEVNLHVYAEDNKENAPEKWLLENEKVPEEWNVSETYLIDNVNPTAPSIKAYYNKYYTNIEGEKGYINPYTQGMITSSDVTIIETYGSYAASEIKKYQYSIYNDAEKEWEDWQELTNLSEKKEEIKEIGSEVACSGTFTITKEGKTIVKTRAVNMVGRAGQPEEESEPFVIIIDRTAPEVEFHNMTVNKNSKEGGTDGVWVTDETVKVVVQDDPAGVNINKSKYEWVKEEIVTKEDGSTESKYEADPSKAKQLILADGEATVRMPNNAEGNYKLWVYVEDNVDRGDGTGNGAEYYSEVYYFDSKVPEAPTLAATVPGKKTETTTKEDGTTETKEVDADIVLPSNSITNKTVTLHMSITKDKEPVSGIAKYQYSTDEKTTWNDLAIPSDKDTKVLIETEGSYRIFVRAINGAGNTGMESIYEVMIDKTKPTVEITPNGTSSAVKAISVVIKANDELSGLVENDEYELYVSDSKEIDKDASTTKFKNGETLNLIGDGLTGEYYLHIRPISDKAGNQSDEFVSNKFIFNNETDKPVITFTNIVTPEENSNVKDTNGTGENNYVRGIRVRITVKDLDRTDDKGFLIKASGVNPNTIKYAWAEEGTTLTVEDFEQLGNEGDITTEYPVASPTGVAGKYALYVYAEDNFGNNVLTHSELYYIDDVAPTGDLIIKATIPGENEGDTTEIETGKITNKNVTLTVEGATALSGVKYQYSIDGGDKWRDTEMTEDGKGKVTFSEEGKYTVIFRAVGGTGIAGEPSNEFKFTIDKTKPEIEVKYIPSGLTNENVLVTLTANEEIQAVEGWTLSDDKKVLSKEFTDNGEETVQVIDIAGNITEVKVKVTNIDREDLVVNQTQIYVDGGVLVTLTANKKLKRVEGWTAIDEYTITKLYQKDAVEVIDLEDIAGNKAKETVVVTLNKESIKPNEGDITYKVVASEKESNDGKKDYYLKIYNKDVTLGVLLRNLVLNGDTSYKTYEVVDGVKTEVSVDKVESTKVKTGSIVIEFATTRYTTIIMGDLDKDGAITFKDIEIENKIRLHPEEAAETLEEILRIASDINGDGKVTFMEDMVKINALRLKKYEDNIL